MSNDHPQLVRYTIYFAQRRWWGGRVKLEVIGTGSSKQDNEVLIRLQGGGFWSVNYAHVVRLVAEPLPHEH